MEMYKADLIVTLLIEWFLMTAISVAYVAWDLFTRTPEMKVMKWGWVLVTLYTGIIGLVVYCAVKQHLDRRRLAHRLVSDPIQIKRPLLPERHPRLIPRRPPMLPPLKRLPMFVHILL